MTRDRKLELWETLTTVLWLCLFGSAMLMKWPIISALLIVPAMVCNLITFAYVEKTSSNVLTVSAVNLWLFSFVFLIMADLYKLSVAMLYAKFVLFVSLVFLFTVIGMNLKLNKYIFLEFYKFRIFRISKTNKNGDGVNNKIR